MKQKDLITKYDGQTYVSLFLVTYSRTPPTWAIVFVLNGKEAKDKYGTGDAKIV